MKDLSKNPWEKLSSKIVYQNNWIKVQEDKVLNPAGNEGIYAYVNCRYAIGIVALTKNLEVYLVGQYRYPIQEYSWEIIEGGGELNEDKLETAKRELKEEAGLTAKNYELIIDDIHLSNCHSNERAFIYLATDLKLGESEPEETEVLTIKKVKLIDTLKMIDAGEIKDAMSIIALQKVARINNITY